MINSVKMKRMEILIDFQQEEPNDFVSIREINDTNDRVNDEMEAVVYDDFSEEEKGMSADNQICKFIHNFVNKYIQKILLTR